MAPTCLKELPERFSLCHVRLTSLSCMISLYLCYARSIFSLSCTISLLSSCTISPIRIRTRIFIVSVHYKFTNIFLLRCIVSAPPVAEELRPLPLICYVRSTFFLSCTNNRISVVYEQPYHVRSSFSLPLRSTWLTEGK